MRKHLILAVILSVSVCTLGGATAGRRSRDLLGGQAAKKNPAIRIVNASFGDQLAHNTCTPDMSICKGLAVCKFTVGDMCAVDSKVKNLEVTWDCGEGTGKKSRAAAKDTEISLGCGE